MRPIKSLILFILFSILAGCATSKSIITTNTNLSAQKSTDIIQLNKSSKISVFVPEDGFDLDGSGEIIKGSGLQAANVVTEVLSKYFTHVQEVTNIKDLNSEIKSARAKGYNYIVYPKILAWTNHYTFWSGIPNKIEVNLRIYDIKKKHIIDSFTIKSESDLLEQPGETTKDLLYQPLSNIANRL
ncbi:MAG: hypothetical protein ACJA0H_002450, partial [Francisellaceae bacterium]